MQIIKTNEGLGPVGVCLARQIYKVDGKEISEEEASKILNQKLVSIRQGNLIVNTGREILARMLGGTYEVFGQETPYIDRIAIGNGEKTGNLPNLSDTSLVSVLRNLDGVPVGVYGLNDLTHASPDLIYPDKVNVFPNTVTGWGSTTGTITIDASNRTILTDPGVDFVSLGIERGQQVTINTSSSNPLVLGIRSVLSTTELVLHNPGGYVSGGQISYRVDSPGTQLLVSKLISGNDFPVSEFGNTTVIKEAGLIMSNGVLFNRVVFAPTDEDAGVLLQSDEVNGVEISVQFEWLITF